jgi:hypothetical protein
MLAVLSTPCSGAMKSSRYGVSSPLHTLVRKLPGCTFPEERPAGSGEPRMMRQHRAA